MIAQAVRAALLAIATVATRAGFRASKLATYGSTLSGLYFARLTSEVMPKEKLRDSFERAAIPPSIAHYRFENPRKLRFMIGGEGWIRTSVRN